LKKQEIRSKKNSPLDDLASFTFKLVACIKSACLAGGASATVLGLGFDADKLLEEAGHAPVFKKVIGNQLGNVLSSLGYGGNSEYLELQKQMLEVKVRAKNIEDLSSIINELESNSSFVGLKKDLKEFQDEFIKELQNEKRIRDIQQSKILSELKNIKKN
jgi:hypothetical protein